MCCEMLRSPLEQFEVVNIGLGVTNSGLWMMLGVVVIIGLSVGIYREGGRVIGGRWQKVMEEAHKMVLDLVSSIGKEGAKYMGGVYTLFMMIVVMNLVGMIPYSFTVTAQLAIAMTLSVGVWLGKLAVGVKRHGVKIVGVLIPEGVPFALVPVFIVLETLSFIMPLISLGVRLFANMTAGHILMHVLFGFTWAMFLSGGVAGLLEVVPLSVMLLLMGLETGIAVIQGYVFALLVCIYLGDMERGGH